MACQWGNIFGWVAGGRQAGIFRCETKTPLRNWINAFGIRVKWSGRRSPSGYRPRFQAVILPSGLCVQTKEREFHLSSLVMRSLPRFDRHSFWICLFVASPSTLVSLPLAGGLTPGMGAEVCLRLGAAEDDPKSPFALPALDVFSLRGKAPATTAASFPPAANLPFDNGGTAALTGR